MIISKTIEKYLEGREKLEQADLQFVHILKFLNNVSFSPRSILDIGCGSILLSAKFGKLPHVSHMSFVGVPRDRGFYAAMHAKNNSPKVVKIDTSPSLREFDLIYSFRSWGHLYDIDVFANELKQWLGNKSYLILDIRKNTDRRQQLEKLGLVLAGVVFDRFYKFDRLAYRWG